ncbi:MAG: murein biosynthesis integral membrane protein MurJ [Chloroflexi bacterium]|nr:MAG: integral membrane protein MviN [Chloroflexi bacterium OLB13]MBC6955376.1 murein biosynthesis integral membrane protein MurJ [Chloroflexota bacterium]MBV6435585.1 Lipid II flippase MurJ [Anaerolineae bacterium]MDL1915690.1 murein biosynthesis integral membrane protein MurJ [Anaerolineae bacterium CFX4]OQY86585.1 MAG: murein biosynthesis integral membrane protein MurJ [Anaerolineae bacterium UTCFX5]
MTEVRALSSGQVARAALVVLLGFLASGVLGVVRTAAYSASFGASAELDIFFGAQRIPELLFTLVAGGALGSAFIPVFTRYLGRSSADAWRLASAVMSWSTAATGLFGLVLAITAPLYMPILIADVPPEYQQLAAHLAQWMLITTVIFSASGLVMGILNAHQQFTLPALAISMYNLGLIFGALVLTRIIPTDSGPFAYASQSGANVYGLAFGAILGALMHLAVQVPGLVRVRAKIRPLLRFDVEGSGHVLRLMLPRVLGLAVTQINFLVNVFFATRMAEGSNSAMNVAWFMMFFALGVIAQSAGTAVFPTLSKLADERDFDGYSGRLADALRGVAFLAIPASVGLIVLGGPVIALLFERGEWTSQATQATAWVLAFFALGMIGHAFLELLSRAFYALGDTRTPVAVGVVSLVANIVLSIVFIQFVGDPSSIERTPAAGLALANSVTTLLEAALLWLLLSRRVLQLPTRRVLGMVTRSGAAALVMGAVVAAAAALLGGQRMIVIVTGCAVLGGIVYFAAAQLFGVHEARSIAASIIRRVIR